MIDHIRAEAAAAAQALLSEAKLKAGEIVVVGCSSSEVDGQKIGTESNPAVAQAILDGILSVLREHDLYLAAQCCEHLGRALIVEAEAAERYGLTQVNVIPQAKAGGSFAAAAYHTFAQPVAVESLEHKAAAGLDIGGTLIGMHLRAVAVPVRLPMRTLGKAVLLAARTRPKFVGGIRAIYRDDLL